MAGERVPHRGPVRSPVQAERNFEKLDQRVARAESRLADLEAGVEALSGPPRCAIRSGAATVCTTSTLETVEFDTVVYDTDGMADLAGDAIEIQTAGLYLVIGRVQFAANATGRRFLALVQGATTVDADERVPVTGQVTTMFVHAEVECAAADVLGLIAFQSSGGDLDVSVASPRSPRLTAIRLSD